MEALSLVMNKAVEVGVYHGLILPKNGPSLSHLFYADDAIFIGQWSLVNALNLNRILRCFFLASGLRVNFNKINLYGVGVTQAYVNMLANTLNCTVGIMPLIYLGMPVGANMNHVKIWEPVVSSFQSKLALWKAKSLSFGGRITLIKSVLSSLPLYYFSLFKAPYKSLAA
jgi:hypothetical protein